jgi:hypothetical protein
MTLEDLELALGTDHRVIVRWVTEGKLRGRRRAGLGEHARYEFTDADLLACFRAHRTLVRLDQVDAEWFLGLVLPPRASRDEGAHPVRSA